MHHWMAVALLGTCFVAGCGSSGGSAQPPSRATPVAPDTSSFDVTWKPETVVLDAGDVAAVIRNPRAPDGIYDFDPASEMVKNLQPGQVLVLTGVDLVRVTQVDAQPDSVRVTTEPASLLDAATDVHADWDIGSDLTKQDFSTAPQGLRDSISGLRIESDPTVTCSQPDAGMPCAPKPSFKGKLGNLDASEKFTLQPDGSMKMEATIKYPLDSDGAVLSVASTATLKSFRHRGNVEIVGGVLKDASFKLDDLDLDVNINAGAVAMGTSDDTFKYPIKVTFPFSIGPVPAYADVSASIALNPSLTAKSSARSQVHFHVTGAMGITAAGKTLSGSGSLNPVEGAPAAKESEVVSTTTAGLGVVLEFPVLTLGVGIKKVASLEATLKGKEEVVVNDIVSLNGLGLIKGSCLTVDANVGAYAAGELTLLNLSFGQEKQLYGLQRKVVNTGNPSDDLCPKK